jgi:hypothetical protein
MGLHVACFRAVVVLTFLSALLLLSLLAETKFTIAKLLGG